MKAICGSLMLLAGALMFGAGKLAQAIALSANWQDTPVSMFVIGGVFCAGGGALIGFGWLKDEHCGRSALLSGSILILAGAVVFAFGKVAMAIAALSGSLETPVAMLIIGCTFSLLGAAILAIGLQSTVDPKQEE